MDIIDVVASDSYIIYNKEFARRFGVEPAVLLGVMCGYQKGFRNEYFYREQEKIMEDTGLSQYAVRSGTKLLQSLGVIDYKKCGMPAKYYYKVNSDTLCRVIDFDRSRDCENARSRDYDFDSTNKNNSNKNYNNNKNNNKSKSLVERIMEM